MFYKLSDKLNILPKIGSKTEELLAKRNLRNIGDLINYFPRKHRDLSRISVISELRPEEDHVIRGQITNIKTKRAWRRQMAITTATASDHTGAISVVWFNQGYLDNYFKPDHEYLLSGKVSRKNGKSQFLSPEYEPVKTKQSHIGRIVPIYQQIGRVSAKLLRFWLQQILSNTNKFKETLPTRVLQRNKLVNRDRALRDIHFPPSQAALKKARDRLAFEELYTLMSRQKQLAATQKDLTAPIINGKTEEFIESLPFTLTSTQEKCVKEGLGDLRRTTPMNRLLNGDVGSGKTVVAATLICSTVQAGHQAIFMAPTEILAEQHFQTLQKLFTNFPFTVSLCSAGATDRQDSFEAKQHVIVGTHALIQKQVHFAKPGLIIIDEEHRFGVKQREVLKQKTSGKTPHFLSLTATPIPRTLTQLLYRDMDVSILNEMPHNRLPVKTYYIPPHKRAKTYDFVEAELNREHRAFVVCPIIDESDELGVTSVTQEYQRLKTIFPHRNIAALHGRLPKDEKDSILRDFRDGESDILVSTSVVEVGIDIPDATIMLIEGADRFGLAQLHQFRGRVGRSDKQSYCFLFTDSRQGKTIVRLKALIRNQDGFSLAEEDLRQRGPGEYWGTKQSGLANLTFASMLDTRLIEMVKATIDGIDVAPA